MGSFNASVETAFSVIEVIQFARALGGELSDDGIESPDHWEIVLFWELLSNAVWVPRLMDAPRQRRLENLISTTHLQLHRNPLMPREEAVSAVTPGATNDLRQRVSNCISERAESTGRDALADLKIWAELEREAAIDFAFRSVRPNFELRACAECGTRFEPQLSNRGRFCRTECRKRFNNARNSAQSEGFTCAICEIGKGMDLFSGLAWTAENDAVSPLRMEAYHSKRQSRCCTDCVVREHREWARYIAPLVDAKERQAAS